MIDSFKSLFTVRPAETPEERAAAQERAVRLAAGVHAGEEHMIRKISGLLHVAHPDFIDAKIKAKSQTTNS